MTMDVQEQKVKFVVAATRQEKSFTALCQEFGISRPTGCLWRRRYQQQGIAGIAEQSRRPQRSPRQTSAELEQRVVEVRQRYPDWGARKLQVILARAGVGLTRSTIHPSCCAMTWYGSGIGTLWPAAVLSAARPTNFGRWISRVRKDGMHRSDRSRCWMTTAAT